MLNPRRAGALVVTSALALVSLTSTSAWAHATLQSSSPAAGALVATSPERVVLVFTETPDARLSSVHVLAPSGRAIERSGARPLPDPSPSLAVNLPSLTKGVYTVTWRVTSAADGHTTAGSFAFGVGVAPGAQEAQPASNVPKSPRPTPAGIAGRWLLYLGVTLLAGSAAFALGGRSARQLIGRAAFVAAAALAVVGFAIGVSDQRAVAHVRWAVLLASRTGRHIRWEAGALAVAAITVVWWSWRRSRVAAGAVLLAAAAVMFTRVAAGHASSSSRETWAITTQWLHTVSVGVWAGGLPLLWWSLRRAGAEHHAPIARRFSAIASGAFAVVIATGVVRSVDMVGAWSRFSSTDYGQALLVKLALVVIVAVVAAVNRTRHIAAVRRGEGSNRLRRMVGAEVVVVALVLGATALLTGLAPARSVAAARAAQRAQVLRRVGHDFATTTQLRLEIRPGTVGINRFTAFVSDFDSRRPVAATAVSLRFQSLGEADVPPSTVALTRVRTGVWRGDSPGLAIDGPWRVTAVVTTSAGALEIPVLVTPRPAPQRLTVQRSPSGPTIFTVTEIDGRQLQAYADPGRAGPNQVHLTYFDPNGEIAVDRVTVTARGPGLTGEVALTARKLDPLGHFSADLRGEAGRYRVRVRADLADGSVLRAELTFEFGAGGSVRPAGTPP